MIARLLRKFAGRKIEKLEKERTFIEGTAALYPEGSFGFEKAVLSLAVWDLKIRVWRALAAEK